MKVVEFGKYKYNSPQKFSELNAIQLFAIATAVANNKTLADGRLYMASVWFPEAYQTLNKYMLSDKKQAEKLKPGAIERFQESLQDLDALAGLSNWVHDTKKHISSTWLIPELKVNGITFFGPADKFANLEFWEYCKADTHFSRYQQNGNLNEFARFIACLYRLPNTNAKEALETGNKRVKFNEKLILTDAARFLNVDAVTRTAIVLNYLALKNWLMGVFPEVLRTKAASDENGNAKSQDIGRIYGKLLLNIAKRRHQDEEVIARKPLLLVFEDQNDEVERYNEQKQHLDSLKR